MDVDLSLALAAGLVLAFTLIVGAPLLRRAIADIDPNETLR